MKLDETLKSSAHYHGEAGQKYYELCQRDRGPIVDEHKAEFLSRHITPDSKVLDVGCGLGGILSALSCKERYAVEINAVAAEKAAEKGIIVESDLEAFGDETMDVLYSNHAFEHMPDPDDKLHQFYRILKPGGVLMIIVPAEKPSSRHHSIWRADDMDQHLYSWTPLTLGNLISLSGFEVLESYVKPLGYTRYINFLYPARPLYEIARHLAAFILNRNEVFVRAVKKV